VVAFATVRATPLARRSKKIRNRKNAENKKKSGEHDSADMTLSPVPILNIGSAGICRLSSGPYW